MKELYIEGGLRDAIEVREWEGASEAPTVPPVKIDVGNLLLHITVQQGEEFGTESDVPAEQRR